MGITIKLFREFASNIIERFGVRTYPTFLYFAPNNKFYRFDGKIILENTQGLEVVKLYLIIQKMKDGRKELKKVKKL